MKFLIILLRDQFFHTLTHAFVLQRFCYNIQLTFKWSNSKLPLLDSETLSQNLTIL